MSLDPRIGKLANGKYYAFVQGYDKPAVTGTLEVVQAALFPQVVPERARRPGRKVAPKKPVAATPPPFWTVTLRFEFPAYDEADGIVYGPVQAASKWEAHALVRRMARIDGHLYGGKGRYWLTAEQIES